MSPGTSHALLIDLPIALALLGPLLFITVRMGGRRALVVPAVMLTILGASALFAFYWHAYTTAHAINYGDATAEVLSHLDELGRIAVTTSIAVGILLASAALICGLMVRAGRLAVRLSLAVFGVLYALSGVWLVVVAHEGASLAGHLASHSGP